MTISAAHQEWLENRGIGTQTSKALQIYSGARLGAGGAVVPSENGNILCFPFLENGHVVAEKYRAAGKRFWQRANPRKTFYNADILVEPALAAGDVALVITEGELDCAAVIEAGYRFVVSAPDGAPPARGSDGNIIEVPEDANDVDPSKDEKFRFIFNNWQLLSRIKRIVLATDNDEPGRRLAAELVRRLGRVRCSFVVWPSDCKDFGEVLVKHGAAEVVRLVQSAKPYPVAGVYTLHDLPQEPDFVPVTTGWPALDHCLKLYHPALLVVTGRAGHGKSTWTQQLVANLATLHDWNIAIASFEMRIKPFVADALGAAYLGRGKHDWDHADRTDIDGWLERKFSFIAPEPDCERVHDVDWLIEKAEAAVIRHGARVLLVDPWNEIEHARRSNENQSDYCNRAVMALKNFGRRFDVLVIIVAHPTKIGASKDPSDLTLYDISDSAAFQNKADLGVVIACLGDPNTDSLTGIFIRKVRYQPDAGKLGAVELAFDKRSRIFL